MNSISLAPLERLSVDGLHDSENRVRLRQNDSKNAGARKTRKSGPVQDMDLDARRRSDYQVQHFRDTQRQPSFKEQGRLVRSQSVQPIWSCESIPMQDMEGRRRSDHPNQIRRSCDTSRRSSIQESSVGSQLDQPRLSRNMARESTVQVNGGFERSEETSLANSPMVLQLSAVHGQHVYHTTIPMYNVGPDAVQLFAYPPPHQVMDRGPYQTKPCELFFLIFLP